MASGDKLKDAIGQWIGPGDWVAYGRASSSSTIIFTHRQIDEVFFGSDELTFRDQPANRKRKAKPYNCVLTCDQRGMT